MPEVMTTVSLDQSDWPDVHLVDGDVYDTAVLMLRKGDLPAGVHIAFRAGDTEEAADCAVMFAEWLERVANELRDAAYQKRVAAGLRTHPEPF